MSIILLDANVLIALGWEEHIHHGPALRWMKSQPDRWATCPFTECAFIRIGSNNRITPGATTPANATLALRNLCRQPRHVFWADDYSPADEPVFEQLQGHRQITDAYLLMLALRHKAKLATFDGGIKTLARALLGDDKRVLLIPQQEQ
ncbi:MAG: PIN domain-containing protein [Stagnimonas sp.]|nr:PIN domain-containing protein [Stagnimonas sp.]